MLIHKDALLSELSTLPDLADEYGIEYGSLQKYKQRYGDQFPKPWAIVGVAKLYSRREVDLFRQRMSIEGTISREKARLERRRMVVRRRQEEWGGWE